MNQSSNEDKISSEIDQLNKAALAKCCDFWYETPLMKEYDEEVYSQIIDVSPRLDILDILVEGLEEDDPDTGNKRIRRALSATEIFDRLNGSEKKGIMGKLGEDEKIKRNNLYFHLDKMVEHDILDEITRTETGRRSTTYFGRVAKIVLPRGRDERKGDSHLLFHPDFKKFILRVNPEASTTDIDVALKKVNRKNDFSQLDNIKKWLIKYEKATLDLNLDMRKLLEFLSVLVRYDSETIKGVRKLTEILGLDEIIFMKTDL